MFYTATAVTEGSQSPRLHGFNTRTPAIRREFTLVRMRGKLVFYTATAVTEGSQSPRLHGFNTRTPAIRREFTLVRMRGKLVFYTATAVTEGSQSPRLHGGRRSQQSEPTGEGARRTLLMS